MVTIRIEKYKVVFQGPSREVIQVQNYYRTHGLGKMLCDMVGIYNQGDMVLTMNDGTTINVRLV